MGLKHYVVQTTDPSIATTKLAFSEIMKAKFPTVWLATRESYTDRHRKTRTLEVSLFPGYLFVEFDTGDNAWKDIPQQRGVRRILGTPMKPVALPVGAVDRLRALFDAGEFKPRTPLPVMQGDKIVVESGLLVGKMGVCSLSRGERIEAMMAEFAGKVVFHRGMVRRVAA